MTHGDNEVNCIASSDPAGCYLAGSTNGSTTTGPVGSVTVVNPGSNYSGTPNVYSRRTGQPEPLLKPDGGDSLARGLAGDMYGVSRVLQSSRHNHSFIGYCVHCVGRSYSNCRRHHLYLCHRYD